MSGYLTDGKDNLANQLLGYVLNELGLIETANSITIKDAKDDHEDQGGQFADSLDQFENVEGKDLVFEDVKGPSDDHGGLSKPIKVKQVIDERSLEVKMLGTQHELVWDTRRKCYVKRRRSPGV